MVTTVRAVFDGGVLRPEQPLVLQEDETYIVTIESMKSKIEAAQDSEPDDEYVHPLTRIGRLATDMGVTDLSENHDWHAHGTLLDDPRD